MLGNSEITEETWDDVEALLIQADMGVPTTQRVLSELQTKVKREGITRADQINKALKEVLRSIHRVPEGMRTAGSSDLAPV